MNFIGLELIEKLKSITKYKRIPVTPPPAVYIMNETDSISVLLYQSIPQVAQGYYFIPQVTQGIYNYEIMIFLAHAVAIEGLQ
jgi:hypothetical protein